ncbi:hypothetical protein [Solirhodobacter olei]|uniref:hypothetical protein n=1 Tax=Solirhodobacter olei TaxID=2493082 RepID=UPI000FD7D021|nr:hypothetical protein [Solirhodobacter olei]
MSKTMTLPEFTLNASDKFSGITAGAAVAANICGETIKPTSDIAQALANNVVGRVDFASGDNDAYIVSPQSFRRESDDYKERISELANVFIDKETEDKIIHSPDIGGPRDVLSELLSELVQNVFDHSGADDARVCAIRTRYNGTLAVGDLGCGLRPKFSRILELYENDAAFSDSATFENSKLLRRCDEFGGNYLYFFLCLRPFVSTGLGANKGYGLYSLLKTCERHAIYSNSKIFHPGHTRDGNGVRLDTVDRQGLSEGMICEFHFNLQGMPGKLAEVAKTINRARNSRSEKIRALRLELEDNHLSSDLIEEILR